MILRTSIFLSALLCAFSPVLEAQSLSGHLQVKKGTLNQADFALVAQTKAGKIQNTSVNDSGNFELTGVTTNDRLSLLYRSNFYSPLILAVKRGKSVKSFEGAKKAKFCASGKARVILTSKSKLKGKLKVSIDTESGVAYLTGLKTGQLDGLVKGGSARAATNCLPIGLTSSVTSSGVSSQSLTKARLIQAEDDDADSDGLENDADEDDDDDGLSDAFDPDNDDDGVIDDADSDSNDKNAATQLFYFQQLHLDRADSYHPKLQDVTTAIIDAALEAHGGLALEVKSGSSVELNCGGSEDGSAVGLPWCSTDGSARTREPYPNGLKFPEDLDSDNDGKGTLTAGPTHDFQLVPGASSSEILPGDTFIEEVDDGTGTLTRYVGVLNSVVLSVPGIVSVTTSLGTNTFDYPASSSSIGTYANPILVPSTGDVSVTINLYPPVYNTSAGQVVPGIMTIGLQLPNGPCTYDPGTGMCSGTSSGPGLLPGSLYSAPSAGWNVAQDGIRSNGTDSSVEDATAVSFTVNLTGTGGVSGWDSGESLLVPVQAFDNNGTTSAHNVIFKRQ